MANTFSLAFQAKRLAGGDEAVANALRAAAVIRAKDALAFADAALAKMPNGTLLGTAGVTAPDIFLAALLTFAGFLGITTGEFVHLNALGAKVAAHPAIAAAYAREQEVG